jgi:hypothetical protein
MVLLRQIPAVLLGAVFRPVLRKGEILPCGLEKIPPVLQALLLHPKSVMLTHVCLVTMISGQLNVIEPVKRSMVVAPEVQIPEKRIGFYGTVGGLVAEGLEMRFSDQTAIVSGFLQKVAKGENMLREFCPQ